MCILPLSMHIPASGESPKLPLGTRLLFYPGQRAIVCYLALMIPSRYGLGFLHCERHRLVEQKNYIRLVSCVDNQVQTGNPFFQLHQPWMAKVSNTSLLKLGFSEFYEVMGRIHVVHLLSACLATVSAFLPTHRALVPHGLAKPLLIRSSRIH